MKRRRLLRVGGAGWFGLLAGCAFPGGEFGERHKPQLGVAVTNRRHEPITVTVSAVRGSTEFFTHTYTLAPGNGDASQSFVGTPTEIRISIEEGPTVERAFSIPAACESPAVTIRLGPETSTVDNGCDSA